MAEEISFQGFGPITKPKTAFAEGFGIESSFAPSWTTEPKLRQNSNVNPRQIFYPFQVIRKYIGGQLSYGVVHNSILKSEFLSPYIVIINGLLSEEYPKDTDSGWVNAQPYDKAYLDILINPNYTINSASIKIDGNYNGDIVYVDGKQVAAQKIIADINSDGTVRQYCFNNLSMMNFCKDGIPCVAPITI